MPTLHCTQQAHHQPESEPGSDATAPVAPPCQPPAPCGGRSLALEDGDHGCGLGETSSLQGTAAHLQALPPGTSCTEASKKLCSEPVALPQLALRKVVWPPPHQSRGFDPLQQSSRSLASGGSEAGRVRERKQVSPVGPSAFSGGLQITCGFCNYVSLPLGDVIHAVLFSVYLCTDVHITSSEVHTGKVVKSPSGSHMVCAEAPPLPVGAAIL